MKHSQTMMSGNWSHFSFECLAEPMTFYRVPVLVSRQQWCNPTGPHRSLRFHIILEGTNLCDPRTPADHQKPSPPFPLYSPSPSRKEERPPSGLIPTSWISLPLLHSTTCRGLQLIERSACTRGAPQARAKPERGSLKRTAPWRVGPGRSHGPPFGAKSST
jgi:hypothetical protein